MLICKYIYIERERDTYYTVCVYTYIYIYICCCSALGASEWRDCSSSTDAAVRPVLRESFWLAELISATSWEDVLLS